MPTVASAAPADVTAARGTVLCVDDEANILASLNRLLRPMGYTVLTAGGGPAALALLEKQPVDVIISDMRMPEMDGAAFLERAAALQPDAIRLLLTGYADVNSTIAAVNRGGIYRYLSKPWNDEDLKLSVRRALEMRLLEKERERLEALTRRQNDELKALNAGLEGKVKARTEELQQVVSFLEVAHDTLKSQYSIMVRAFANLVEMRAGATVGHSTRVAEHAQALARRLGLSEVEAQSVQHAALVHDIGKMGLSDALMQKPFNNLTADERAAVIRHPVLGEAALMELEPLAETARLVRSHHERWDGQGYPDRISGERIPLGARILSVVNDFDALLLGTLVPQRLSPNEARAFLIENKGKRYDPAVVDAFVELLGDPEKLGHHGAERCLKSGGLEPGMMLARDLATKDGLVLIHRGRVLDASVIKRVQEIERTMSLDFSIYVRA